MKKSIALATVLLCGGLLIYISMYFPAWGDPDSPASRHVSPYYIENSIRDTAVPNTVTAVLADYRGYDTMFETTVIFSAAVACFFLLRSTQRRNPPFRLYRHTATGITLRIERGGNTPYDSKAFERIDSEWVPFDLIVKTTCRLVIPFLQLFALYVIAHGHHSPGGGFQGGVILGAALILFAVSFNLRRAIDRVGERTVALLCAAGVMLYAGTGALSVLLGGNFLDYSALAALLFTDPVTARSHGILIVEIGVGLAVMAAMIWIFYNLSSEGKHDEGL